MNNKRFVEIFNTDELKIDAFERIASEYYDGNFGTMSKSQFDLLMFNIYSEACRKNKISISDYSLSKELGIGQTSVRNLRKKEFLVYNREFSWKEELLKSACRPALKGGSFVISIEDPNVQIEVQHYIEEKGGVVDKQLNSKNLTLSPLSYVEMLMELQEQIDGGTKNYKNELIKQLKDNYKDEKKIADKITAENFTGILKKQWPEVLKIALNCFVSKANLLSAALKSAVELFHDFDVQ